MNKICTIIDQSKKLLELGVNIHTADMFYPNRVGGIGNYALFIEWKKGLPLLSQEIPAWSLSALLELIPERIPGTKLVIKWEGSYYIEGRDGLFDTAIDAAFAMVCWLLENKKI